MKAVNILQSLWDAHSDLMPAEIRYTKTHGWVAIPDEIRWIGDQGEQLGDTYEIAIDAIEWLSRMQPITQKLITCAVYRMNETRSAQLEELIRKMPLEEQSYWLAKCDGFTKRHKAGKRALRLLLSVDMFATERSA